MPAEILRTFFAVDVRCPASLRGVLDELSAMGRALRTVEPDHWHVTLKFLGATSADLVPSLTATLEEIAAEPAFEVALAGLGAFPGTHRPSIVWAGLEHAEPLRRLATALEREVEPLGFAREPRPFTPHVTLARVKFRPPPALAQLLDAHAATRFGTAPIDSVVLYRSDTAPGGPRYTPLARRPLATASAP